jgi:hypothetical protein
MSPSHNISGSYSGCNHGYICSWRHINHTENYSYLLTCISTKLNITRNLSNMKWGSDVCRPISFHWFISHFTTCAVTTICKFLVQLLSTRLLSVHPLLCNLFCSFLYVTAEDGPVPGCMGQACLLVVLLRSLLLGPLPTGCIRV